MLAGEGFAARGEGLQAPFSTAGKGRSTGALSVCGTLMMVRLENSGVGGNFSLGCGWRRPRCSRSCSKRYHRGYHQRYHAGIGEKGITDAVL